MLVKQFSFKLLCSQSSRNSLTARIEDRISTHFPSVTPTKGKKDKKECGKKEEYRTKSTVNKKQL